MKSLRYLNTVLTILTVLLALNVWTAWTSAPQMVSSARADGIPDAGAQRKEAIDQLKKLNLAMDNLATLLKSGQTHVRIDTGAEEHKQP